MGKVSPMRSGSEIGKMFLPVKISGYTVYQISIIVRFYINYESIALPLQNLSQHIAIDPLPYEDYHWIVLTRLHNRSWWWSFEVDQSGW